MQRQTWSRPIFRSLEVEEHGQLLRSRAGRRGVTRTLRVGEGLFGRSEFQVEEGWEDEGIEREVEERMVVQGGGPVKVRGRESGGKERERRGELEETARKGKVPTVWFENDTVSAASTSQPRSCRGKVAALFPGHVGGSTVSQR